MRLYKARLTKAFTQAAQGKVIVVCVFTNRRKTKQWQQKNAFLVIDNEFEVNELIQEAFAKRATLKSVCQEQMRNVECYTVDGNIASVAMKYKEEELFLDGLSPADALKQIEMATHYGLLPTW